MTDRIRLVCRHLGTQGTSWQPTQGLITSSGTTSPGQFQFTVDNTKISREQREFYETNGFLVIRKLVPEHKLAKYGKRFQDLCEKKVVVPGITLMRDVAIAKTEFLAGEKAITKIQNFCHDDELFDYCALPEIVEYVKCFTGPNSKAMHTMLINKPPDPGTMTSRHPMHQDLHYFPFRPADRIVCSWTAMERVNRDNGCLVVIAGSHKGELLEHEYPNWEGGVNKMYHGVKNFDVEKNDRIWLEMEAGDTVFFHPILIHGSGANRTNGFRKAISCHYAACECFYIDVKGTIQEMVAEEVTDVARKKFGDVEIDYRDVWRGKSRLVSGVEVNI